ncbi:MAG: hypothetical protein AAF408_14025 [Pseudomonadota bacterium]
MSWLSTLAGVLFIGNGLFGEVEAPMLGRTLGPQDINVAAAVETDLELFMASTAFAIVFWAVMMTAEVELPRARRRSSRSRPVSPGMRMSRKARSKAPVARASSAESPLSTSLTSKPTPSSASRSTKRIESSSSATRARRPSAGRSVASLIATS